jgi:hypothetical protein
MFYCTGHVPGMQYRVNGCASAREPHLLSALILRICMTPRFVLRVYEGESNENRKTEIKIRNIAPLSYKLADMLPVL